MAGYSGTPLPKKLRIKPGSRVAFVDAPTALAETLGALPPGVSIVPVKESNLDVIVCFVTDEAELRSRFIELKPLLAASGGLWMARLKNRPRVPAALNENVVREAGLAAGLVDNKVCAIDEAWSGLRFVYRVSDRPAQKKAAP